MRKIPDNVPDQALLEAASAQAADQRARSVRRESRASATTTTPCCAAFLDTFGFNYEFASATDYYKSGKFDAALLRAAENYDAIMDVMLPTLGEERQATYTASCRSRPSRDGCSTCR